MHTLQERLRGFCHPACEAMSDEARLSCLVDLGNEAADELDRLSQSVHDLARNMNSIVEAAHAASSAAGWWTDPETGKRLSDLPWFPYVVSTKLMLIVSEVSEAMEGHRKGLPDDKLPHRRMIEVELADAIHRIADLAGALGCDLGGALVEKMAFNAVRPDHKPGARMAAGGKAY